MSRAPKLVAGLVPTSTHSQATTFGWPTVMRMALACAYTGLSRWTLARAVKRGELEVAGRRSRSLVFIREALDRYLVGAPMQAIAATANTKHEPAPRASVPSKPALERLRLLRGGAR